MCQLTGFVGTLALVVPLSAGFVVSGRQVLEMEPRHFGALRGLGLLRMRLKVS